MIINISKSNISDQKMEIQNKFQEMWFSSNNQKMARDHLVAIVHYNLWSIRKDDETFNYFYKLIADYMEKKYSDEEVYMNLRELFKDRIESRVEVYSRDDESTRRKSLNRGRIVKRVCGYDFHPRNMLDIGCADGSLTTGIAKAFKISKKNTFGVSLGEWDEGRGVKSTDLDFIYTPITEDGTLPFEDNSFDLITLQMTLHHVSEYQTMMHEINRVLSSDGYLYVRDHDVMNRSFELAVIIQHELYDIVMAKKMLPKQEWKINYGLHLISRKDIIAFYKGLGMEEKSIPNKDQNQNIYRNSTNNYHLVMIKS